MNSFQFVDYVPDIPSPLLTDEFSEYMIGKKNIVAASIRRNKDHELFRILFLPPGGIRGNATLRRLRRFEETASKPVHECFDLIVAASASVPLAIALTVPDTQRGHILTTEELEPLYEQTSQSLLRRDFFRAFPEGSFMFSGRNARQEFEKLWPYQTLGDAHCHLMMSTHGALPVYRSRKWFVPLVNTPVKGFTDASMYAVSDIARAAIAIPAVFPPVKLNDRWLRDGAANEIGALPFERAIHLARKIKRVNQPIHVTIMTAGYDYGLNDRWGNWRHIQNSLDCYKEMQESGAVRGEVFMDVLRSVDPALSESEIETSASHIEHLRQVEDTLFVRNMDRYTKLAATLS